MMDFGSNLTTCISFDILDISINMQFAKKQDSYFGSQSESLESLENNPHFAKKICFFEI